MILINVNFIFIWFFVFFQNLSIENPQNKFYKFFFNLLEKTKERFEKKFAFTFYSAHGHSNSIKSATIFESKDLKTIVKLQKKEINFLKTIENKFYLYSKKSFEKNNEIDDRKINDMIFQNNGIIYLDNKLKINFKSILVENEKKLNSKGKCLKLFFVIKNIKNVKNFFLNKFKLSQTVSG